MEQAVGEGVNALSLEGRGVSAEKGPVFTNKPQVYTHTHTHITRRTQTHI